MSNARRLKRARKKLGETAYDVGVDVIVITRDGDGIQISDYSDLNAQGVWTVLGMAAQTVAQQAALDIQEVAGESDEEE